MRYEDLNFDCNNSYCQPLEVTYVNKNKHKVLKGMVFSLAFICLFVFNVLFIMDAINTPFTNRVLYTVKSIFSKPTNELFDDGSKVFFVNWMLDIPYDDGVVEFMSPVKTSEYTKFNDGLVIDNAGKLIFACERGVVSKLEYVNDELKYIEVTHPSGYVSCYRNVDFVGVVVGDNVKKGNILGCSFEMELIFALKKDNVPINIDLENGVIKLNE